MKQFSRVLAGLIISALCMAALASQSIVGKWKGHLTLDQVPKSASMTPQQRAQVQAIRSNFAKLVLLVDIKKDGTFTEEDSQHKSRQSGTWVQKGNQVTLSPTDKSQGKSETLALSKNGKVMVFHVARITVTLQRA